MVLIYPAGISDPSSGIKTACVQPGQCPAKLWARLSVLQDFIADIASILIERILPILIHILNPFVWLGLIPVGLSSKGGKKEENQDWSLVHDMICNSCNSGMLHGSTLLDTGPNALCL